MSATGFCFALSHSLAESSQFYLQSAAARSGDTDAGLTARRQSQAVDNLAVIMDTIGIVGRHSPQSTSSTLLGLGSNPAANLYGHIVFFPLHIVSNWMAHTTSSLFPGQSRSAAQQQTETMLNQWWGDLFTIWGIQRRPIPRQSPPDASGYRSSGRSERTELPRLKQTRFIGLSGPSDRRLPSQSPIDSSRSEVMLPPARPTVSSSRSEPERLPNITPRRLFDLLDDTAGEPSQRFQTGQVSSPVSNTATSGLDGMTAYRRASAGSDSVSPKRDAQAVQDTEGDHERKKRRIGHSALSARSEGRSTEDALEERMSEVGRSLPPESSKGSEMSGMAVLATAAAASR